VSQTLFIFDIFYTGKNERIEMDRERYLTKAKGKAVF
jgi:hypothetical protein